LCSASGVPFYALTLIYGEDIGCDDSDVPQPERRVKLLGHPVGCLGEARPIFAGTLAELQAASTFQEFRRGFSCGFLFNFGFVKLIQTRDVRRDVHIVLCCELARVRIECLMALPAKGDAIQIRRFLSGPVRSCVAGINSPVLQAR
jgi:hypothetical protein